MIEPRAAAPVAVRDRTAVPVELVADPKIYPRHLVRQALIYVRQSHPTQIQRHPESARRQYGLVERAEQLGWGREQISVIDEDQGKSAAGSAAAHGRDGFAQLVSAVGLGEVGIVLALEVSRLARNSAEWYRLLELAALAGTLIADDATVYEPRLFNDRLLLGLRGTISEVELHCIQERLRGARLSKARRVRGRSRRRGRSRSGGPRGDPHDLRAVRAARHRHGGPALLQRPWTQDPSTTLACPGRRADRLDAAELPGDPHGAEQSHLCRRLRLWPAGT